MNNVFFNKFYKFDMLRHPVEYLETNQKETLGKLKWCLKEKQLHNYIEKLNEHKNTIRNIKTLNKREEYEKFLILEYIKRELATLKDKTHKFYNLEEYLAHPFYAIHYTLIRRENSSLLNRKVFPNLSKEIIKHVNQLTKNNVKKLSYTSFENVKAAIDNFTKWLNKEITYEEKLFKIKIFNKKDKTYIAKRLSRVLNFIDTKDLNSRKKISRTSANRYLKQYGATVSIEEIGRYCNNHLKKNEKKFKQIFPNHINKNSEELGTLKAITKRIKTNKKRYKKLWPFIPTNDKIYIRKAPIFMKHEIHIAAILNIPNKLNASELFIQHDLKHFKKRPYYHTYTTLLHEVYPGHHSQYCLTWPNSPLIALRAKNYFNIEAWAEFSQYCLITNSKRDEDLGFLWKYSQAFYYKAIIDNILNPLKKDSIKNWMLTFPLIKARSIPETSIDYFLGDYCNKYGKELLTYPAGYLMLEKLLDKIIKMNNEISSRDIEIILKHLYLPFSIIERDFFS